MKDLYTRPPVTRVVNDDIKLARPPQIVVPTDHSKGNRATTYKPLLVTKKSTPPLPTTFRPKTSLAKLIDTLTTRRPEPVITTTTTSSPTTTPKPSTPHYTADRPADPIIRPPMRPNIKDLLATIGLTAEVMPPPNIPQPPPELTPEMRDLLNSFGLLTNEAPPKNFLAASEAKSAAIQDEFVPIPSYNYKLDDSFHVDEATPIQTDFDEFSTPHYKMNTDPDLSPHDFYAFKPLPLPEEETYTSDMESFFKSVGLLDGTYRNKKSYFDVPSSSTYRPSPFAMMEEIPEVRVDFLSPDMLSVLGNLGISNGNDFRRSDVGAQRRSDDVLPVESTSVPKKDESIPIETTQASIKSTYLPKVDVPTSTKQSKFEVPNSTKQSKVDVPTSTKQSKPEDSETSASKEVPIEMPLFKPVQTGERIFVVGSTTATKTKERVSIVLPTQIDQMMDEAVNAKPKSASVVGKVEQHKDETADDFAKLQHLLETIQRLEKMNGSLTNADLDSIDLSRYNLSQTLLSKAGPDPVAENEANLIKNEVKRQSSEDASESPFRFTLDLAATTEEGFLDKDISDTKTTVADNSAARIDSIFTSPSPDTDSSSTTSSSTTSSSSSSTTSTTTTTTTPKPTLLTNEERQNGLEDSFGGGSSSGLDPVADETLPPPRRNGFYFFSDWNSFLEVGEDPDKVVVRFDPKLGDSSRFIPVEIPSKSFR